jgi:predicted nucleotidyltransferase
MHPLIEANRNKIAALCRQYGVRKLDVFGSVLSSDFDPARSDVDVVAEFNPLPLGQNFDRYLGFKTALETLFARPVDLVEMNTVRNTRMRRHIEASRVQVYATA